jgi:hypothetical protein
MITAAEPGKSGGEPSAARTSPRTEHSANAPSGAPSPKATSARDAPLPIRLEISQHVVDALQPLVDELLPGHRAFLGAALDKDDSGIGLPFHQDLTFTDEPEVRSYSIWVPLVPTGPGTGGLRVVPGSHRWSEGVRATGPGATPDLSPLQADFGDLAIDVTTKPGDVVVWDNALVHGSYGNTGRKRRPVLIAVIAPDGVEPVCHHRDSDGVVRTYPVGDDFLTSEIPLVSQPPDPPLGVCDRLSVIAEETADGLHASRNQR